MPQYKDPERGSWFCKFYYTDWTGERKSKMKRGFPTKREAAAWEREFLDKRAGNPDMLFKAFVELYLEDMAPRLKESTMIDKQSTIERLILPYFGERPISSITSADIMKWQTALMSATSSRDKPFAPGTIRYIDRQLAAILNYAIRFYGLAGNPHAQAGSIGKHVVRVQFWTTAEFNAFIACVDDISFRVMFYTLYYTGLRLGELLDLRPADIDFEACCITVSKTFRQLKGRKVSTSPKSEHSSRTVTIPPFIKDLLQDYINRLYLHSAHERIFTCAPSTARDALTRYCQAAGVKRLTPHSLRHTNVTNFDRILYRSL